MNGEIYYEDGNFYELDGKIRYEKFFKIVERGYKVDDVIYYEVVEKY